jgi:hypothetical protein
VQINFHEMFSDYVVLITLSLTYTCPSALRAPSVAISERSVGRYCDLDACALRTSEFQLTVALYSIYLGKGRRLNAHMDISHNITIIIMNYSFG